MYGYCSVGCCHLVNRFENINYIFKSVRQMTAANCVYKKQLTQQGTGRNNNGNRSLNFFSPGTDHQSVGSLKLLTTNRPID